MPPEPNIVLFMPETLRADAVFGPSDRRARTPNIDRLATGGISFTNCFAQMSFCSPSRINMFTGRYPHVHGQRSLLGLLKPDQRNFFMDLKEAGYRNVAFGKNDLLAPESIPLCFDEVTRRVPVDPAHTYRPEPHPPGSRWEKTFYHGCRRGTDCHDRDWSSVQSALQFLDEDHDRPFCLYLPLSFVHPPYQVEEPFFSMHSLDSVPEPIPAEHAGKRTYMKELHRAFGVEGLSSDNLKEIKRTYWGMTSRVDYHLGLVLDKLAERGLEENTIVVVFSDHGDYAGDYGMVEKFLAGFEDCLLHVPLVVRAPGMGGGGRRSTLCEMTDLYPTLMELAGLEPAHDHFGRSLCPAMHDDRLRHREEVFAEGGHHRHESRRFHVELSPDNIYRPMYDLFENPRVPARAMMVRTDRWKYTYSPHDRSELFDLVADPDELTNLADDPAHADTVNRLRERLLRWMLDTSDTLPPERDPRGWGGGAKD